jgi:hypothetical protein
LLQKNKLPETSQLCTLVMNLEELKSLTHQRNNERDYETYQDQIVWRDLAFVIPTSEDF